MSSRSSIRRVLIANRGEIAVRIIRTCRAMGIETVAVYSDFDQDAVHVRLADQAAPIGGPAPRDSYLKIAAILDAAARTGADAVHPGYGFLAENADFAAACEQAGVIFIGPRSKVIRLMGSKTEGRKLAQEAGVPVAASPSGEDVSQIGLPVLIKAAAGGGGRGMRIVRSAHELQPALHAAQGEAERAFGDGSLLVEKYIEAARHVEIQIMGDHHGNVIHLFERDCSAQRRHQKIIEETPSPALNPEIRQRMAEAAVALGRKMGYTSAGTMEFLLAPSGEFYFIEANTRIQVEHPVTEMTTGLDLIRLQIDIAEGRPVPAQPVAQHGHAIEARLYAEDPGNNFVPATGKLHVWELPEHIDGVRIDSGVEQGTEVGVYYDPLLAKVIAHAPDRESAINKLIYALRHVAGQGVTTNREFLINLLESDEFRAGKIHTGTDLSAYHVAQTDRALDGIFGGVLRAYIEQREHAGRRILPSIPLRYRNNPYPAPAMKLEIAGREIRAGSDEKVSVLGAREGSIDVLIDGVRQHFEVRQNGDHSYVRSSLGQRTIKRLSRFPQAAASGHHQAANSPMPGQVLRIVVTPGQQVKTGDPLVVLEAMKMEQTVKAAIDGVVGAILVKPGEVVAPGQTLVEIESLEDANEHTRGTAANN